MGPASVLRTEALDVGAVVDAALRDEEGGDIGAGFLRIGAGGLERLADIDRGPLGREAEQVARLVDPAASDEVHEQLRLLGAAAVMVDPADEPRDLRGAAADGAGERLDVGALATGVIATRDPVADRLLRGSAREARPLDGGGELLDAHARVPGLALECFGSEFHFGNLLVARRGAGQASGSGLSGRT